MAGVELFFYQLKSQPYERAIDRVLPILLQKTLESGKRAIVRSHLQDRIEHLDEWLWTYRDDSFLPHSRAGNENSARPPVILTIAEGNPNNADLLYLIDGCQASEEDLHGFARISLLFDGNDSQALAAARSFWRDSGELGHSAVYWEQEASGAWRKKAERESLEQKAKGKDNTGPVKEG